MGLGHWQSQPCTEKGVFYDVGHVAKQRGVVETCVSWPRSTRGLLSKGLRQSIPAQTLSLVEFSRLDKTAQTRTLAKTARTRVFPRYYPARNRTQDSQTKYSRCHLMKRRFWLFESKAFDITILRQ